MLLFFKRSIERQIIFLLLLAALSWGGTLLLDVHPRFKFSPEMLLRGLTGGVLCIFAVALLHLVLLILPRLGHRAALQTYAAQLQELSLFTIIGAALTAAAGEELFFRGVLFSTAARYSFEAALAGHFFLMLLVYIHGRALATVALAKAAECSLYAYMYFTTRSLCMVGTAHFLAEICVYLLLRSPRLRQLLAVRLTLKGLIKRISVHGSFIFYIKA